MWGQEPCGRGGVIISSQLFQVSTSTSYGFESPRGADLSMVSTERGPFAEEMSKVNLNLHFCPGLWVYQPYGYGQEGAGRAGSLPTGQGRSIRGQGLPRPEQFPWMVSFSPSS